MVVLVVPFNIQFITCIAVAFAMSKLLLGINKLINDPRFWVKEVRFRQDVLRRFQQGYLISPHLENNWYFTKLGKILAFVLIIQQGILVYALMDMLRWYAILEKIVSFHESNPAVPRPNISPETLDDIFSPANYIYYSGVILALGGVFLISIDNKLEGLMQGRSSLISLSTLAVVLMIKHMLMLTNSLITNCTAGETMMKAILPRQ